MATVQHETITTRELRERLDRLSREKLGISADEFITKYKARELNSSSPGLTRLTLLARLILAAETPRKP